VLVVVAIIALLIAILLPSLNRARELSRRTVCGSNQKQIMTGVQMYASEYAGSVPHSAKYFNASSCWIAWQNYLSSGNGWVHLGHLYGARQVKDPRVFFCPSNREYPHVYPEGWEKFSAGGGIERRATGYMYGIMGELRPYKEGERIYAKLKDLRHEALVSCMFAGNRGKSQRRDVWAHPGGLNAGYDDGSVQLKNIDRKVARLAADLYDARRIDELDLFAWCMFRLFSGDRKWIDAYPNTPPGV
jgi:type II secretory pathway pseudopilin PulG